MRRKIAFIEAFGRSLGAWFLIRLTPYRMWRSRLGTPVPLASATLTGRSARGSGDPVLEDVAWAHAALVRLFGTGFTCLMLAFSARAMLRRRDRPSLLVLGVKRNAEAAATPAADKLAAHAWVVSQGFEVVGGEARQGHMPVAAYVI